MTALLRPANREELRLDLRAVLQRAGFIPEAGVGALKAFVATGYLAGGHHWTR